MKKSFSLILIVVVSLVVFQSCKKYPSIRSAESVELDAFMGDWYVVANIPTFIEKGAHNAVESYSRGDDNKINTVFTFNKDKPKGVLKKYEPTGFVQDDDSNAIWKMQFVWPFKSEFIIVYVNQGYKYTIIGRSKRDYLWIMSRQPKIPPKDLEKLVNIAVEEGYNRDLIQYIPHD